MVQGYNQEERIDYDEIYAPIARLEAIRMLLAFVCHKNFKLYQIDVKSVFLNWYINKYMWNNILGLRILIMGTMCSN